MSKENNDKKYKYLVTTRWYVETNEELVAGAAETDEKILNLVQHRTNGKPVMQDMPYKTVLKVMVSWTTTTSWVITRLFICQLTS